MSSIVRLCLGLSANQLKRMIEGGVIFMSEGYPLKKRKVKNGDRVLISKKKLQSLYIKE